MQAFLIAFSAAAIAEIGDRTQFLSLVLSAKFRKPWSVIAGLFLATLINHTLAGVLGTWVGHLFSLEALNAAVGISMLVMAAWILMPDELEGGNTTPNHGAFITTLFAIFVTEFGDKTQIVTVALAAGYSNLLAVVAGTTAGMIAVDIPVVFLGNTFASRLPRKPIKYFAFGLFAILGMFFITKAISHSAGLTSRPWLLQSFQASPGTAADATNGRIAAHQPN